MTNHISILPTEMLAYPFSFLEPEELARIARVSKEWYNVQEIEGLWQRHCLDHLDGIELHQDTWKEQFKVIKNWMHARAEKQSFPLLDRLQPFRSHNFTVLEDNIPLEVYPDESLTKYAIHNFVNGKITPIDHEKLKDDKIVSTRIHDKTCIALTQQGKILFFDLLTGQYLKEIIPTGPLESSSLRQIECNDQEIITILTKDDLSKKIQIWDLNTLLLKQTIDVSDELYVRNSTPNFIIFTAHDGEFNIFSLRRSDQLIAPIGNLGDFNCAAVSGRYVFKLCSDGKMNIFEDTGEELTLISVFKAFASPFSNDDPGSIYIRKNRLLVSKDGTLKIFDIKTGTQLSTIQHNERSIEFCSNASQLFTHAVTGDRLQHQYTLYNFEKPVTDFAPAPIKKKKKKCIIQ